MFLQCNRAGKHIVCNLPDPNPCYKSRNIELDRYTNFERAKLKWSSGKWGIKFYVQYNVSTLFNVQCTLSLACQKRFFKREIVAVLNHEILNVFHTPFPLYATQLINPFLNLKISANHDTVGRLSANMLKFLWRWLFLYCKIFRVHFPWKASKTKS